ncbi:MAG TPA: hypothetical protein P5013_07415, partial [Methanoregula sp.]|nr:hypothetical protein [Methanoregula sp.]
MVKAGDEGKPMTLQHTGSLTVKVVDVVMENLFYGSCKRFTMSGYVRQKLHEQRALLPQVRCQGRSAGFLIRVRLKNSIKVRSIRITSSIAIMIAVKNFQAGS